MLGEGTEASHRMVVGAGGTPHIAAEVRGEGPPLLLIHGGVGSRRHWVRNIQPLARHFTVYGIDLPGYGESDRVDRNLAPEDYLDVVFRGLERLVDGAAELNIAGFSFGGATATAMAARFGARTKRLALIGPSGFGRPDGRVLKTRSYREAGKDEAKLRETIRHNLLAVMLLHPESVDEAAIAAQRANVEQTRFNSRKVSWSPVLVENLPRLRCPVQCIWGDRDQTAWPSVAAAADKVRALRPDARIDIVPDCGHWAMYERADAVNRLLADFLNGGES